MRRGCISQGQIICSRCGGEIPAPPSTANHAELERSRYLVLEEDENGNEVEEGGTTVRLCTECALEKGYAHYHESKGDRVLSFLPLSD